MARLGAGTRKRTDGMLEKRFTDGRRYSIYARTSKKLVQKEQEIRKKIEAGIYTDNRNLTLDKYFEEWLTGKRNGTIVPVQDKISCFRIDKQCKAPKSCPVLPLGEE